MFPIGYTSRTMAWMDLCGFSDLRWGSNSHPVDFTSAEEKIAAGDLQITKRPQEIESPKDVFN